MTKILENGAWSGKVKHNFDESLYEAIISLLKKKQIKTLIDVGCGDASYSKSIAKNGISCTALDGNPDVEQNSGAFAQQADFSIPFFSIKHLFTDCVLCLEVGEHIPKEREQIFIENIKLFYPKLLILSWAIPGQGGVGHINEQTNEYIKKKFSEYTFNEEESSILRNESTLPWFKNTIMVFE